MRYDLLHPKALRKAVIEHLGTEENVPQERQFRRWVTGDTPVPGWAQRVIGEIMQVPEHRETPPPEWVTGLREDLITEIQTNRDTLMQLLKPFLGDVTRALEDMERTHVHEAPPRQPSGANARRNSDTQDASGATRRPPTRR